MGNLKQTEPEYKPLTRREYERFAEWLQGLAKRDERLACEHESSGGLCSIAGAGSRLGVYASHYVLANLRSLESGGLLAEDSP